MKDLLVIILLVTTFSYTAGISQAVATSGGNSDGANCVFPFIYKAISYSSCIPNDSTKLWCATTWSYSADRKWGNCIQGSCAQPNKWYYGAEETDFGVFDVKSWKECAAKCREVDFCTEWSWSGLQGDQYRRKNYCRRFLNAKRSQTSIGMISGKRGCGLPAQSNLLTHYTIAPKRRVTEEVKTKVAKKPQKKMAPKVGRLNENNCPEYAYLRGHGNMWQYDPDKVHPKMVERLYKRFDKFDLDGDNRMTLTEVKVWPQRIRDLVSTTDEEIERMKAALVKVFGDTGVTEDGLPREDWIESNRVFMEAEKERIKNGDPSHVALIGNAYFDVLDEDGTGTVSMKELKTMMIAFKVPKEAAYTFFEKTDVNKNGRLEREEMHVLFRMFWLLDYDTQYDAIFAYQY